jgi:hypothetical protein
VELDGGKLSHGCADIGDAAIRDIPHGNRAAVEEGIASDEHATTILLVISFSYSIDSSPYY